MTEDDRNEDTGITLPPEDDGMAIEFVGHDEPPPPPPLEVVPPPREQAAADQPTDEERYLRLRADFENYRKRVERDREEHRRSAAASLVKDLLPPLDNLHRALEHIPEGVPEEWRQGVEMVLQQFDASLGKAGLESVSPAGQPFDPAFHEAVSTVPAGDLPPNHVADVLEKGYTLQGKLLRPARVRVTMAAEKKEGGPDA